MRETPHSPEDRITESQAPVEPKAAVSVPAVEFPLKDHTCDRQGVPTHVIGEWDYVEDHDLPQRIIQNAIDRVAYPLSMTQMYLSGKVIRIAEAHLPRTWPRSFIGIGASLMTWRRS